MNIEFSLTFCVLCSSKIQMMKSGSNCWLVLVCILLSRHTMFSNWPYYYFDCVWVNFFNYEFNVSYLIQIMLLTLKTFWLMYPCFRHKAYSCANSCWFFGHWHLFPINFDYFILLFSLKTSSPLTIRTHNWALSIITCSFHDG